MRRQRDEKRRASAGVRSKGKRAMEDMEEWGRSREWEENGKEMRNEREEEKERDGRCKGRSGVEWNGWSRRGGTIKETREIESAKWKRGIEMRREAKREENRSG